LLLGRVRDAKMTEVEAAARNPTARNVGAANSPLQLEIPARA